MHILLLVSLLFSISSYSMHDDALCRSAKAIHEQLTPKERDAKWTLEWDTALICQAYGIPSDIRSSCIYPYVVAAYAQERKKTVAQIFTFEPLLSQNVMSIAVNPVRNDLIIALCTTVGAYPITSLLHAKNEVKRYVLDVGHETIVAGLMTIEGVSIDTTQKRLWILKKSDLNDTISHTSYDAKTYGPREKHDSYDPHKPIIKVSDVNSTFFIENHTICFKEFYTGNYTITSLGSADELAFDHETKTLFAGGMFGISLLKNVDTILYNTENKPTEKSRCLMQ